MLNVLTLILGELDTNCYLVWCDETSEAAIIDPADSGDLITEKILELKLIPKMIILTHGHYDHCLACLELKLNFPARNAQSEKLRSTMLAGTHSVAGGNIPILIHQDDLFLYQKANHSADYYGNFKSDPLPPPDEFLNDNQNISVGQKNLTVIHTPGHTPGSVCIHYHPERAKRVEGLLFSGDTLFANGVGRTDLPYSDPQKLQSSLKKLAKLPKNTQVLPGHGESTFINQILPHVFQEKP